MKEDLYYICYYYDFFGVEKPYASAAAATTTTTTTTAAAVVGVWLLLFYSCFRGPTFVISCALRYKFFFPVTKLTFLLLLFL